jgi:transposase
MQEQISLSTREVRRLQVLDQVVLGKVTLKVGASLLGVCYRQAKRLLARLRKEGPKGLAHRQRGRVAPNALGRETRDRVLALHQERYAQFNDTHFVQMLEEREDLRIGRETVRRWLRAAGIAPKRTRRSPQHRSRRPRRAQEGLMVQWDGSPHRWFGPAKPPCSLLHAVDDASNRVLGALFRPHEDAIGYLRLLDQVVRRYGVPVTFYQDRHSALQRHDNHWSHEEELAGLRFATHVGRVIDELGAQPIPAYSAQAKGRIERQGAIFQDRLVAEMALDGITEIDQANEWLETTFLPRHNARFARAPEQPGSAFRKISAAERYRIISFAYEATVANDNTVRLGGLIIDLPPGPRGLSYARRRVLVRQHLDGAWSVWLNDRQRIARHPQTPLREPWRGWRPHQHGEYRKTRHILQVYYETTPAPNPRGHFSSAVEGTS